MSLISIASTYVRHGARSRLRHDDTLYPPVFLDASDGQYSNLAFDILKDGGYNALSRLYLAPRAMAWRAVLDKYGGYLCEKDFVAVVKKTFCCRVKLWKPQQIRSSVRRRSAGGGGSYEANTVTSAFLTSCGTVDHAYRGIRRS